MSKLPDTKDVQAFLATIRSNPFDDTNRLVFADYLRETCPEEVDLIAAYAGGAKQYLHDLVDRCVERYKPGAFNDFVNPEDAQRYWDSHKWFDYEYVVEEALRCIREGDEDFNVGNTMAAQDVLDDETVRREFWSAIEVITGYHVPPEFRHHVGYYCSC